jgi:signal transduction histidine kinase/phage shock protein PspC (stress-responsive transcriptional regulator)
MSRRPPPCDHPTMLLRMSTPGLRFRRSARARLVTGVVAGLAERLEVEPFTARLLVIVLALAGGLGVAGYLVAWGLSSEPHDDAAPAPPSPRRTAAAASATLAVLLLVRDTPLWPGDGLMAPVVLAAAGAGILAWRYRPPDADETRRAASSAIGAVFSGRLSPPRLLVGGLLLMAGVVLLAGGHSPDAIARAAQSVALALAGATIVLGPWLGRLVEQLDTERRQRIRSEERAAMAAHLHDSVLQTLAMIQRSHDDPRRMVRLARRQERELRAWLYGDQQALEGPVSLVTAAELLARDVETDHDVRVELVVVGDHPLSDAAQTLLGAVREALVNAARHAEVDAVSVYVEAEPHQLSAFVRDRGRGFDIETVPADRHGIADSIRGRLARAGGRTALLSAPGDGTEVQLTMPLPGAPP